MAKAERGTKRQCLKCGTKFYDLNADPIVCPACGAPFLLEVPVPETSADKSSDDNETDEVEKDEAAVAAGAEIVSFEDAEEDSDDNDDEDDVLSDVDDVDEVDDIGGEVDNSFIEDDDDDDDDELGIPVDRRNDDDE